MDVDDWFICIDHADRIRQTKLNMIQIAGITMDEWLITPITPTITNYYQHHPKGNQ
jgi:hypothetical protein